MLHLLFFIFINTIDCRENLIKNPSFEEIDSDNKPKFWEPYGHNIHELSSDSHSGEKSLYWIPNKNTIVVRQFFFLEHDFRYEICVYFKLKNIYGDGFQFYIEKRDNRNIYQYSNKFNGTNDWRKECFITKKIKSIKDQFEKYLLGVYTHPQENNDNSEVFVDDITVYRIPEVLTITISNDRDKVYDNVNIVYQINTTRINYTLNDWELITRIKDNNKTIYEAKNDKITSSLFTNIIDITKYNLMDNKFYQIEVTLKSKIDDTIDIVSYIFKKITQKKREVTFDKHGRIFINNELYFPLGLFVININETLLEYINKTHINFIMPYNEISKEDMDLVYTTQKGKIKVMYSIKDMFDFDYEKHIDLKEEKNYKKAVEKINELKNHPALFAWLINDEYPPTLNKYFRNRTLTIHELDPNHPTYTVLCKSEDIRDFINTTDYYHMIIIQ